MNPHLPAPDHSCGVQSEAVTGSQQGRAPHEAPQQDAPVQEAPAQEALQQGAPVQEGPQRRTRSQAAKAAADVSTVCFSGLFQHFQHHALNSQCVVHS